MIVAGSLEVVGDVTGPMGTGLSLQLDDPAPVIDEHRVVRRAALFVRVPGREVDLVHEHDVSP